MNKAQVYGANLFWQKVISKIGRMIPAKIYIVCCANLLVDCYQSMVLVKEQPSLFQTSVATQKKSKQQHKNTSRSRNAPPETQQAAQKTV